MSDCDRLREQYGFTTTCCKDCHAGDEDTLFHYVLPQKRLVLVCCAVRDTLDQNAEKIRGLTSTSRTESP